MKTLIFLSLASFSHAAVLNGTGSNLPIGDTGTNVPGISRDVVVSGGSWTGTWTAAAMSPWVGTFNVTGPTLGSSTTGTANYDFTTLPSTTLPIGTFFTLGDVDESSGLTLRAWDSSGNLMSLWLNEPLGTYGTGGGPSGSVLATDTPSWAWNVSTSSYSFDGSNVSGNPTLAVLLTNNQAITTLEVVKPGTSYGFSLRAPAAVPEPSSALLGALAGGLCLFRRKRSA